MLSYASNLPPDLRSVASAAVDHHVRSPTDNRLNALHRTADMMIVNAPGMNRVPIMLLVQLSPLHAVHLYI